MAIGRRPLRAIDARPPVPTTKCDPDAANCRTRARLDRDRLSRGMSDPASLRAHAPRYRKLRGREITWADSCTAARPTFSTHLADE